MKSAIVALLAIGVVLGLGGATQPAAATVIISETFSGGATTNLVGTSADVGGVWTGVACTEIKKDGSDDVGGGGDCTAYNAFTLVPGRVYTYSAFLNPTGGGDAWYSMGFSAGSENGDQSLYLDGTNTAYGWWLLRDNGGWFANQGPDSTDWTVSGSVQGSVGHTLKVVLDTTNTTDYTVEFFIDGWWSVRGQVSIGTPAIDQIAISSEAATGYFDDVLLTDDTAGALPVPEPAGLALVGMASLTLRRRRA